MPLCRLIVTAVNGDAAGLDPLCRQFNRQAEVLACGVYGMLYGLR